MIRSFTGLFRTSPEIEFDGLVFSNNPWAKKLSDDFIYESPPSAVEYEPRDPVIEIFTEDPLAPQIGSIWIVSQDENPYAASFVPLDDPDASPIRVMTTQGILALQKADVKPPDLRNTFAIMLKYESFNDPSQALVDEFIDILHTNDKIFKIISLGSDYIYVFSTEGTYINVDTVNKKITSDGLMFSVAAGEPNRARNLLVDWSSFATMEVVVHETYIRP
jgi:hypothetical protein